MFDWISVKDREPTGVSRNYLTFRPSAPLESRVSSTWFDPRHNGWSGNHKVTYWMELPPEPITQK